MSKIFRLIMRWEHLGASPLLRLVQGGLLGVGAPLGWHLIRHLFSLTPENPSYEMVLDSYMMLGTIFVFSCFGYVIGKKEEAFAEQSMVDALTSLYNARQFKITLQKEFARAKRVHAPLALLVVDIDFFKRVNDTYGHPSGDAVLAAVAHELVMQVREADTVARVGGEEFAVILPGTDLDGACVLAERMREEVSKLSIALPVRKSISVNVSIGVASTEVTDGQTSGMLYACADKALYTAKETGRNKVAVGYLSQEESQS